MIQIFKTEDGAVHQIDEIEPNSWIALTDPTAAEILEIADAFQIDPDPLRAPLDEEERSRLEIEDNYSLVLVDIPSIEERNGKYWYVTIPIGIVMTAANIITVCLEETPVLNAFMDGRVRDFHTYMAKRVPHRVTDVEKSIRSITEKSKPLAVPNIKNSTISAKVLF